MDNYGEFIWPAYLVVFSLLIILGARSFHIQKKLELELNSLKENRRSAMDKED